MLKYLRSINFLILFATLTLQAQFLNLRTTEDGSVLYFTTPMIQTGTDQPAHGKAFRLGPDGLSVAAMRALTTTDEQGRITNFYDIQNIDVSADGKVLAVAARRDCGAMGCASFDNMQTTVGDFVSGANYDGLSRLSGNGQYLVNYTSRIPRAWSPLQQWNLATGETWTLTGTSFAPTLSTSRTLADNGLVVGTYSGDAWVWEHGTPRRLTYGSESISSITIDALGASVVFLSQWPAPYDGWTRLRRIDLATGELVTVDEDLPDYRQPALTSDGSLIAFLSAGQLYTVHSDGSALRQITNEPDGLRTFALSGNGLIAYGLTNRGRLVRIEVEAAAVTELLGPNVSLDDTSYVLVPGSRVALTGSALDDPGLSVTIAGAEAPILESTPHTLTVQIPWECPTTGSPAIHLNTPAGYPFTASLDPKPLPYAWFPKFFGAPRHQSGERPVTTEDPAAPDEVVSVLMTGLGPVTVPIETGQPGPVEPPALLADPIECYVSAPLLTEPIEVPYAGLEPGAIGLYRLSLHIPANPQPDENGKFYATCRRASDTDWTFGVTVPVKL